MPHPRCYQPELHPHLIKGLHHEAKRRGVPMTKLLARIVSSALEPTEGMRIRKALGPLAVAGLLTFGIKLPETRKELDSFVTGLVDGKLLR